MMRQLDLSDHRRVTDTTSLGRGSRTRFRSGVPSPILIRSWPGPVNGRHAVRCQSLSALSLAILPGPSLNRSTVEH
eukprot:634273-Hanusia_phi.AAC.1